MTLLKKTLLSIIQTNFKYLAVPMEYLSMVFQDQEKQILC